MAINKNITIVNKEKTPINKEKPMTNKEWHEKLAALRKERDRINAQIEELVNVKPISDAKINEIISNGINDIFANIQKEMNVAEGDFAGMFHSGSNIEVDLFAYFRKYADEELKQYKA